MVPSNNLPDVMIFNKKYNEINVCLVNINYELKSSVVWHLPYTSTSQRAIKTEAEYPSG